MVWFEWLMHWHSDRVWWVQLCKMMQVIDPSMGGKKRRKADPLEPCQTETDRIEPSRSKPNIISHNHHLSNETRCITHHHLVTSWITNALNERKRKKPPKRYHRPFDRNSINWNTPLRLNGWLGINIAKRSILTSRISCFASMHSISNVANAKPSLNSETHQYSHRK